MQNIFIIDDEKELVTTLISVIEASKLDVEITSCYNSKDAFSLIENKHIDLFIVDYYLDKINGISFINKLREKKAFKRSKFLIITGKDKNKKLENKFIKLGLNYLLKPFELKEFISVIKILLQVKLVEDEMLRKKTAILNDIIRDEDISYEDLKLFLFLLHNTNDGIWSWDILKDKISGSHNLWRNFGLEGVKEITTDKFLSIIHPEDVDKFKKLVSELLALKTDKLKVDIRIKNNSGDYRWFSYRGNSVLDKNGVVCKIIGVQIDISKDKLLLEKYLTMAYHDELTGLPNRLLLFDRAVVALENAFRNKKKVVVLFIDLDDFKKINDDYGHDTGDQLLIKLSQRINSLIRKMDTFARYGGDEFVLMLSNINDMEFTGIITKRIIDEISTPFEIFGNKITIAASIGVAVYPNDGDNINSLINFADKKMYKNKAVGKKISRIL